MLTPMVVQLSSEYRTSPVSEWLEVCLVAEQSNFGMANFKSESSRGGLVR